MRNNKLNQLSLLLCFVYCGLFIGCGESGPKLIPAGGVVNYKGKPIGKINVLLMPKDAAGMMAEGTTDAEGKFTLQTKEPGDGAMVGNYSVAFKYVPDEIPSMFTTKKPESPIPDKYGDGAKSGHTATVDADKSKNNFVFNLE